MGEHEAILNELARAVVAMDEEGAVAAAHRAIETGLDPYLAITEGLSAGMREVGELYDRGEYFVPEILICSDAMLAAIEVLKPRLRIAPDRKPLCPAGRGPSPDRVGAQGPVKVILGVVEGDIHDLGKNIVKIMLQAAGFEVQDLGRDVPPKAFVQAARAAGAGIVGLSTLMSTTLVSMEKVVRALAKAGLRDRWAVMIGGGPTSSAFAEKIGADAHGRSAKEAVDLAQQLAARLPCLKTE